jgi:hypothetical protein
MSTCPQCRFESPVESKFCCGCGAPLTAGVAAVEVPPVAPASGGVPGAGIAGAVVFPNASADAAAPASPTGETTFPAAPRVRRIVAALIDLVIGAVFMIPFELTPMWMAPFVKSNVFVKLIRFIPVFYLLLRDSLGGRSVGKALMGLVTWDRNLKRPANVVDSVVRNWPLVLTLIPWVGWAVSGLLSLVMAVQILVGARQRFGDGFATTQVVDEKWLRPGAA